jgi:hypothetical protein
MVWNSCKLTPVVNDLTQPIHCQMNMVIYGRYRKRVHLHVHFITLYIVLSLECLLFTDFIVFSSYMTICCIRLHFVGSCFQRRCHDIKSISPSPQYRVSPETESTLAETLYSCQGETFGPNLGEDCIT